MFESRIWFPPRDAPAHDEQELEQYRFGSLWIVEAALLLDLPAVATNSAKVILHRFYTRRKLTAFDIKFVAAASLYLSAKVTERPRRVREIIGAYHYLNWLHKEEDVTGVLRLPADNSPEFKSTKLLIHRVERHILRETGFSISQILLLPHHVVVQYVHTLFGPLVDTEQESDICQRAWNFLNDCLWTPTCALSNPAILAAAGIYLALAEYGIDLFSDAPSWCACFEIEASDLLYAANVLIDLYSMKRPVYFKMADPPVPAFVHKHGEAEPTD